MAKAYSETPISKFCYASNIMKIVDLRELKYKKEMSPIIPCDNFLCNNPECIHHQDHARFSGESIDYLNPLWKTMKKQQ